MPQIFQVLKCYTCSVFQIHQTKKSNKFDCKMCGERQSIKRHYGIGTGKDCRMHVQKLNILRGDMEKQATAESNSDEENVSREVEDTPQCVKNSDCNPAKRSKWSTFIDKEKETGTVEESMFLGNKEVFLEIPQKTKTRNFKVKPKQNHLETINNCAKDELIFNAQFNNKKDIDNFESKELLVQNDTQQIIKTCKKQQTRINFDDLATKALENPVVLQNVNKNSKWAQYIDTKDNSDILTNHESKPSISNSDNLFSLCDDSDLDSLLDI